MNGDGRIDRGGLFAFVFHDTVHRVSHLSFEDDRRLQLDDLAHADQRRRDADERHGQRR
jgi:hypothetical protein